MAKRLQVRIKQSSKSIINNFKKLIMNRFFVLKVTENGKTTIPYGNYYFEDFHSAGCFATGVACGYSDGANIHIEGIAVPSLDGYKFWSKNDKIVIEVTTEDGTFYVPDKD